MRKKEVFTMFKVDPCLHVGQPLVAHALGIVDTLSVHGIVDTTAAMAFSFANHVYKIIIY